jgi:hypothetical protein
LIKIYLLLLFTFLINAKAISDTYIDRFTRLDNGGSEVTETKLFASKGDVLSEKEISYLITNISQESVCKYPAIYSFIQENYGIDISFEQCTKLNGFLTKMEGQSASIVFVTSTLNTPSSYFGHVFLKINKENNRFFSPTISFAAEVPANTGISELIIKGISGGFRGRYHIQPFFRLYESYRVIEERGLVEYQLAFNEFEVKRLLLHLYELMTLEQDYYYFKNNCAYELMWLIGSAKKESTVSKHVGKIVSPYDVVLALKEEGLIINERYDPPVIDSLYVLYDQMNQKQKKQLKQLISSDKKIEFYERLDITQEEKDNLAFAVNTYYDLMFKRQRIMPADYDDIKNIKYERPIFQSTFTYKYEYKNKLSIGFSEDTHGTYTEIRFSPALFNKEEDYNSRYSLLTMELLNTVFKIDDSNVKLESITLVELESYRPILNFYYPPSWKFKAIIKRDQNDNLSPLVDIAFGYSKLISDFTLYALFQAGLTVETPIYSQILYGVSYNKKNFIMGFDIVKNIIYYEKSPLERIYLYVTLPINEYFSIKYESDFEQNKKSLFMIMRF